MKMASQRFCLRWNNHQSNLLSVFDQLLHAETFTDVTLAVDGQYLKAHKMVLSACSPYFNALFVNHPEKHPIVILKDVPYSDMKSLLDFMYRGEVSVDQERLTAFLRVAESLRIKGLTEVNDDKPAPAEPPPPPQLQRIQPYLVQHQQQQHHQQQQQQQQQQHHQQQQQRHKSQQSLLAGNNGPLASQQVQQQSLLSSALAAMPKRKRGRPRKLSGSSNGTGNDYDDFEREGMLNDSDIGDGKLGNDSFSGNDDDSGDNQRDSGDNDNDLNESRDSLPTQPKKLKQSKDIKTQPNDHENSTSVQLISNTPELSQRLFGVAKVNALVPQSQTQTQQQQQLQKHQQQSYSSDAQQDSTSIHLPTLLGLKIKNPQKQSTQQQQHQSQSNHNSNSLLKQQLRSGLKHIDAINVKSTKPESSAVVEQLNSNDSCSALQSLASVAERQAANTIQPPSANNLHHQFLLHMAANPMMKPSSKDYYQQQQQQSTQPPSSSSQSLEDELTNSQIDLILEQSDQKSDSELMLADETAGLEYKSLENSANDSNAKSDSGSTPITTNNSTSTSTNTTTTTTTTSKNKSTRNTSSYATHVTGSSRPVQRRRVRRKAQSTIDDQAEHLTEMSVRGLDLFRYASITEGVYQCTECAKENVQKTFKNKYSFQRHAFLYHEGKHRKVFPCPLCGKEFSRPDKMKNHMKMTHESYVTKDLNSFNPLNYLISAAAAGEIHSTLFSTQQQQQSQQQQQQQSTAITTMLSNNGDSLPSVDLSASLMAGGQSPCSPTNTPATTLLKLQNEIIIKNEIVISPSPSPPPIDTTRTRQPTHRLEEVK